MALDGRTLPLTRAQLDVWLAHETGCYGTGWQLGLFVRIEGPVQRDPLEWAIRRVIREAEPVRAGFFQEYGQVVQRAIDYEHVELTFHDLSSSHDPVEEAYEIASSIQRTPMAFSGPLFKFALFRTRPYEFYWFTCCHHIIVDGFGLALVGHRIAAVYSAVVSGRPIPPAMFGSLQDLVSTELAYETSPEYLEDQSYWTTNLPSEKESQNQFPEATGERDPYRPSTPVLLDRVVLRRVQALAQLWEMPHTSIISAACALLVRGCCAEGQRSYSTSPSAGA